MSKIRNGHFKKLFWGKNDSRNPLRSWLNRLQNLKKKNSEA